MSELTDEIGEIPPWQEAWDALPIPNISISNLFDAKEHLVEDINGFVGAVDWTEPWIIALLLFHVILFMFAFVSRKDYKFQVVMWIFDMVAMLMAQPLNYLGMQYWEFFARQPYFTKSGGFMALMYSTPLLILGLFIVINLIVLMAQMMIKVKRLEFKRDLSKKGVTDKTKKKQQ